MSSKSRHPLALLLLLTALLTSLAGAASGSEQPQLRRVILISCDTLRALSLPRYGNPGTETVGIDSLANQGTVFLHCLSPMGWTLPAHVTMFTGLSPGVARTGVEQATPSDVPLMTEVLADDGFVCGSFPALNQWLKEDYGFDRGFRQYRFQEVHSNIRFWTQHWSFRDELPPEDPEASFFLFFHFMDTHSAPADWDHLLPYWAPTGIHRLRHGLPEPPPRPNLTEDETWDLAAYDTDLLRRAYDSSVYSLDYHHIRPLLSYLRDQGLADETMIILTADHGEEIGEHGGYLHDSPYNEVREVPLIIVWPGVVPKGETVFSMVSLMDIMPTVLDYAGLEVPDHVQGLSLRPLLSQPRQTFPERDFLIDGQRRGLSLEPAALVGLQDNFWWSIVATLDTTGCEGSFTPARVDSVLGLYNLDLDPGEANDLQAAHPDVLEAMKERLNRAMTDEAVRAAALLGEAPAESTPMSDADRRKLRALGY